MQLKQKPPPGRTPEQLYHHYLVESEMAQRIRAASPEERKQIYATMYDRLFAEVPDHPRLTRRASPALSHSANAGKARLVRRVLRPTDTCVEFGSGDCQFAALLAKLARFVYAVDISDQRASCEGFPDNFRLIIYDGYNLPLDDSSIDFVFSDQLLEHFHPEEAIEHLRTVWQILKPGGKYLINTPHRMSGPHDISKYFCDTAEGFHLKEWTYDELRREAQAIGYRRAVGCYSARGYMCALPMAYFAGLESLLSMLPWHQIRRRLSRYTIPSLCLVLVK